MNSNRPDTQWTDEAIAELRRDFGDAYSGRTVLVTGADGFMGSHLTEALCHLGANVNAFVRATSSGALNNIGHVRSKLRVHFADLTDKTSIDYLMRELAHASGGQAAARTALAPGADGFMASHRPESRCPLAANVKAHERATASGALNNTDHVRNRLRVHSDDLTDDTSIGKPMLEHAQ